MNSKLEIEMSEINHSLLLFINYKNKNINF